jgi:hypothetical protein
LSRFHSPDWFTYLKQKLPLEDEDLSRIIDLDTGSALVFASRHKIPMTGNFTIKIRKRITSDRGSSKTNLMTKPSSSVLVTSVSISSEIAQPPLPVGTKDESPTIEQGVIDDDDESL